MNTAAGSSAFEQRTQAIQKLIGLIQGIAIDRRIDDDELQLLNLWLEQQAELLAATDFQPVLARLTPILHQRSLSFDDCQQLLQLCQTLHEDHSFFDQLSNDLQQLQGLLSGILADHQLSRAELQGLSFWLQAHRYLAGCWPYDEIHTLIQPLLQSDSPDWLQSLCRTQLERLNQPELPANAALCLTHPQIQFAQHSFAFLPTSAAAPLTDALSAHQGRIQQQINAELDYLVIETNADWSFLSSQPAALQADQWRRQGYHLRLIRLIDLQQALAHA